jgi:hypothetical protein
VPALEALETQNDSDAVTTHQNYGADVIARMAMFAELVGKEQGSAAKGSRGGFFERRTRAGSHGKKEFRRPQLPSARCNSRARLWQLARFACSMLLAHLVPLGGELGIAAR